MERYGKMGVHLDIPINGFAGRLEMIEGTASAHASGEATDRGGEPDAGRAGCRGRAQIRGDVLADLRLAQAAAPGGAAGTAGKRGHGSRLCGRGGYRCASAQGGGNLHRDRGGDVVIRAEPGVDDEHLSRIICIARAAQ